MIFDISSLETNSSFRLTFENAEITIPKNYIDNSIEHVA
jgi:hypothetical protein